MCTITLENLNCNMLRNTLLSFTKKFATVVMENFFFYVQTNNYYLINLLLYLDILKIIYESTERWVY